MNYIKPEDFVGFMNKKATSLDEPLHYVTFSTLEPEDWDWRLGYKNSKPKIIKILQSFDIIGFLEANNYERYSKLLEALKKNGFEIGQYYYDNILEVMFIMMIESILKGKDLDYSINANYMICNIYFNFKESDELKDYTYNEIMKELYKKEIDIKLKMTKNLVKPQAIIHKDMFGNDIIIGDIGIGCGGKGNRVYPLRKHEITSVTKVYVNGNILPSNFVVLKAVDGRPLKGV